MQHRHASFSPALSLSLFLPLYLPLFLSLLLFATFHSSVAVATTATNKRSTVTRFERRRLLKDRPIRGGDHSGILLRPAATTGYSRDLNSDRYPRCATSNERREKNGKRGRRVKREPARHGRLVIVLRTHVRNKRGARKRRYIIYYWPLARPPRNLR